MSGAAELLRALHAEALARVAPAGPTARALAGLDLAPSIVLLATGKAALGMADGAAQALGDRIRARAVVAPVPRAADGFLVGAHPVPDARSEAAGRALLAMAASARDDEDVVALVSGGGSALSAVPAAGLALADKAVTIAQLAAASAPIADLNCVRRHLSAIKGGRLAAASRARVTTLVVSDVVGDALAEVASGPTVPDPTSFADACAAVGRWVGWDAIPPAARAHLEAGRRGELDQPAPRPRDRAQLLLGLGALVDAARDAAVARGLSPQVLEPRIEGEVRAVAEDLAGQIASLGRGALLVAGGEATVVLPPRPGVGGRAQQLALLLARALRGRAGVTCLVAGSDGIDGASDAAGAVVDGGTWDTAVARGLDPDGRLAACDAAPLLAALGAHIVTGPTGVNHADLLLVHTE